MSEIESGWTDREKRLSPLVTYFQAEAAGSLPNQVYRALRRAILAGDLQPGEKIAEVDVTKVLPVSRTPIREAFRSLESEGLVAPSPSRGVVVRGVKLADLVDIYQLLECLEALAARLAAARISDEELLRLKGALDLTVFFAEQERWEELTEQGAIFHGIIYESSGNLRLCTLNRSLREHAHGFRRFRLRAPSLAWEGVEGHIGVYEALAARDGDRAADIMTQHLQHSRRLTEELVQAAGEASNAAEIPGRRPYLA